MDPDGKHDEIPNPRPVSATPAAEQIDESLAAGEQVDHFKVLRLLGRGGMGEVYLARDTKLGRRVALKLVHPTLLAAPRALERFLFEARATARFSHPNIVTIHHVGSVADRPYVALEYVPGQSLRQRLKEQRPGTPEAMRVGLAVAEALAEAHRRGILHRDLKPDNVLIGRDGRVRVVDFGLAKVIPRQGLPSLETGEVPPVEPRAEGHSEAGLKGTPRYMAPEQWRQLESSGATDVWALGLMLFELATGRHPYPQPSLARRAAAVCDDAAVPRADEEGDVPAALADIIAECLDKDPDQRPPAEQAAQRLSHLLNPALRPSAAQLNPYLGLMPFTEQHAAMFHGRDQEIAAFVERLRGEPVLPVVGPSGAGKSSFVQAGVIPRLREQGGLVVLPMRPGGQPFTTLASRIIAVQGSAAAVQHDPEAETLDPVPEPTDPRVTTRPTPRHDRADRTAALARQLDDSPALLNVELHQLAEQQL